MGVPGDEKIGAYVSQCEVRCMAEYDMKTVRRRNVQTRIEGVPQGKAGDANAADVDVARAIEKGDAQAGVLLRPASVSQIIDIARGGERMPPKTTFFHPKPRTGVVFRTLD